MENNVITEETIRLYFDIFETDKGFQHGYHRYYSKIFEKIIPNSLLEIGVKEGRSLAAWRSLFPDINLAGIDITENQFIKRLVNFSDSNIYIGDSTNKDILEQVKNNYDIIIDDGSHYYKDIIKTFSIFKEKFNHFYIIEDAMYKIKEITKHIENLGFSYEIHPSRLCQFPAPESYLEKNTSEQTIIVDLFMIVVHKQI